MVFWVGPGTHLSSFFFPFLFILLSHSSHRSSSSLASFPRPRWVARNGSHVSRELGSIAQLHRSAIWQFRSLLFGLQDITYVEGVFYLVDGFLLFDHISRSEIDPCLCLNLVNREPDATDMFALYGATALKLAIENAGSLDPTLIRQALVRNPSCSYYYFFFFH